LIDPQDDATESSEEQQAPPTNPTAADAAQPPTLPPGTPVPGVEAPRGQVSAEAVQELGVIVISASNAADVAAVRKIIEAIVQISAASEAKVELVPLEHADATNLANTLTQLYQRVIVTPSGNSSQITGPRQQSSQFGLFGQINQTTTQPASVAVIPIPRLNALLVGAPKSRFDEILAKIKQLDVNNAKASYAVPFQLKKASSSRM